MKMLTGSQIHVELHFDGLFHQAIIRHSQYVPKPSVATLPDGAHQVVCPQAGAGFGVC